MKEPYETNTSQPVVLSIENKTKKGMKHFVHKPQRHKTGKSFNKIRYSLWDFLSLR